MGADGMSCSVVTKKVNEISPVRAPEFRILKMEF